MYALRFALVLLLSLAWARGTPICAEDAADFNALLPKSTTIVFRVASLDAVLESYEALRKDLPESLASSMPPGEAVLELFHASFSPDGSPFQGIDQKRPLGAAMDSEDRAYLYVPVVDAKSFDLHGMTLLHEEGGYLVLLHPKLPSAVDFERSAETHTYLGEGLFNLSIYPARLLASHVEDVERLEKDILETVTDLPGQSAGLGEILRVELDIVKAGFRASKQADLSLSYDARHLVLSKHVQGEAEGVVHDIHQAYQAARPDFSKVSRLIPEGGALEMSMHLPPEPFQKLMEKLELPSWAEYMRQFDEIWGLMDGNFAMSMSPNPKDLVLHSATGIKDPDKVRASLRKAYESPEYKKVLEDLAKFSPGLKQEYERDALRLEGVPVDSMRQTSEDPNLGEMKVDMLIAVTEGFVLSTGGSKASRDMSRVLIAVKSGKSLREARPRRTELSGQKTVLEGRLDLGAFVQSVSYALPPEAAASIPPVPAGTLIFSFGGTVDARAMRGYLRVPLVKLVETYVPQ